MRRDVCLPLSSPCGLHSRPVDCGFQNFVLKWDEMFVCHCRRHVAYIVGPCLLATNFSKTCLFVAIWQVVSKTSTLTSGKRTRRRSTRDLISASPKGGKCGIQIAHKRFSVASLLCYECEFFQNMFICCNLTKLFPKHPLLLLASEPIEGQQGIWFLLRRKVASAAFNLHTSDFPSHRFSVTNVWLQRMEKCAMICNAVRVSHVLSQFGALTCFSCLCVISSLSK